MSHHDHWQQYTQHASAVSLGCRMFCFHLIEIFELSFVKLVMDAKDPANKMPLDTLKFWNLWLKPFIIRKIRKSIKHQNLVLIVDTFYSDNSVWNCNEIVEIEMYNAWHPSKYIDKE